MNAQSYRSIVLGLRVSPTDALRHSKDGQALGASAFSQQANKFQNPTR